MRKTILAFLLLFGLIAVPAIPSDDVAGSLTPVIGAETVHAQAPKGDLDIKVSDGSRAWHANPVWTSIGVLALILLILLIVLASRSGGRTVVK